MCACAHEEPVCQAFYALEPPHALRRLFGSEGHAPGQFRGPFGVALSPCGARLHVVEAAGGESAQWHQPEDREAVFAHRLFDFISCHFMSFDEF